MAILILGLDGMTWEVLEPLMAAGELPTLRALCDRGVWGSLDSTIPPVTPSAWASMLTGKNPGQHGVWGFRRVERENGRWVTRLTTRFDYAAMPLWRILQRFGRRGAFFNVPCAYPLDDEFSSGILTSGYLTPTTAREFTYPRSIRDHILSRFPDFDFKLGRQRASHRDLVPRGIEIVRMKFEIIRDLRQAGPWDVLFAVIDEPDALQHALWPAIVRHEPEVARFYTFLDHQIGRLVEDLDRAGGTLLIVSDHGFQGVTSLFCVNEALAERGYLRFHRSALPPMLRSKLMNLIHSLGPGRWAIERYRRRVSRRPGLKPAAFLEMLSSARVVAVGSGDGMCTGIYPQSRNPELLERLSQDLCALAQEFPQICLLKAEDLYHGPHVEELPCFVMLCEGPMSFHGGRHGTIVRSIALSGIHSRAGVILAYGPGVRPRAGVRMHIYDVLPTVLSLLGLPVPNDLDGRPALEMLPETEPALMYDVRTGAVYDPTVPTGPTVQERLRRLGVRGDPS